MSDPKVIWIFNRQYADREVNGTLLEDVLFAIEARATVAGEDVYIYLGVELDDPKPEDFKPIGVLDYEKVRELFGEALLARAMREHEGDVAEATRDGRPIPDAPTVAGLLGPLEEQAVTKWKEAQASKWRRAPKADTLAPPPENDGA